MKLSSATRCRIASILRSALPCQCMRVAPEFTPLKVRPGAKNDWIIGQNSRKHLGGGALGDGSVSR
jgi:hypothetical protein